MNTPNSHAPDLTVVYEDAGTGRLTASIPGTISWGPTQPAQGQRACVSPWASHDARPALYTE
jgi:hypothetical protein